LGSTPVQVKGENSLRTALKRKNSGLGRSFLLDKKAYNAGWTTNKNKGGRYKKPRPAQANQGFFLGDFPPRVVFPA
jgi:hypothetical protein